MISAMFYERSTSTGKLANHFPCDIISIGRDDDMILESVTVDIGEKSPIVATLVNSDCNGEHWFSWGQDCEIMCDSDSIPYQA